MENQDKKYGDIEMKSPLLTRLDNFWYHYKWHTVAAIFLVFVLIVLGLQTCSRVSYDGYILYAGNYEIKKTSQDGDVAAYSTTLTSLKGLCEDFDNDGSVNATLLNLFIVNGEEADRLLEENPGESLNTTLINEDTDTLAQTMLYGDYYVCFLSERLFFEYEERYSGALFQSVEGYLAQGKDYDLASENGVYLGSLDIYSLPGICDLPEDTVVCLRALSEVSGRLNKAESKEAFARGEQILKNILSFEN